MPKIEINIPKPCSEKWNQMSPNQKGRFCNSCQKTVYDFSSLPDHAVIRKIKSESALCGRFSAVQLNRELVASKKKSTIWTATITGILSLLNSANDKIQAQAKPEINQIIKDENFLAGDIAAAVHPDIVISGIVTDAKDGIPMPGVNVNNLSKQGIGTTVQTDFDGKFKIPAAKDDILVFSFVGYKDTKKIVADSKIMNVAIAEDPNMVLAGEVVVVRKRTFFGRIFHSIGNLFR